MSVKRKYVIWVPVWAFLTLLSAGLVVSCMTLKDIPAEEWRELSDPAKILSGDSTHHFTRLLNQHFVLGNTFNQIERGLEWSLTGDWGRRVRQGCEGWLFLTDELEIHPDRIKAAAFRANLAVQLDRRLKERGIKLIMAVVPDKTRIEQTHLCALRRSDLLAQRAANWSAMLQTQGIETLDLTAALASLPGERYYRTDTHWNEAGANAAALMVASRLGQPKEGAGVTLSTQAVERPGDLVHLAGLDGVPKFLRPPVEMATVTKVAPIAVQSDDLFGDAGLPTIALVGTSYSRNSNFVPFLEHHLGEPVANLAKDGGDFSGAATAYFGGVTFRDNPPKVVIWEVPERVIEMPLKDAERKWAETLSTTGF